MHLARFLTIQVGCRFGLSSYVPTQVGCGSVITSLTSIALLSVQLLGLLASPVLATDEAEIRKLFEADIEPFLKRYCVECHNKDLRESGIQVDNLTSEFEDATLPLWESMDRLVSGDEMPPENAKQPTEEEGKNFVSAVLRGLEWARSREMARNGNLRRLTVLQYANTLRDLLGIEEELTAALPPDGISKDGFANNSQSLQLSPLQLEAYLSIAEKALDLAIVNESEKPVIQTFQMKLGEGVNKQPLPESLVLGALNHLLPNHGFTVTELPPDKDFEFMPFRMQTKWKFIEGYQGNDTVRGWRDFDSIYHSVFACMRGSEGYPKGTPYQLITDGLLLRPAIPSPEIFGESSTYGPFANFKIALRELPQHGQFRIRVTAKKYKDGLLLGPEVKAAQENSNALVFEVIGRSETSVEIKEDGIYQVDLYPVNQESVEVPNDSRDKLGNVQLAIGDLALIAKSVSPAFTVSRLPRGKVLLKAHWDGDVKSTKVVLTKLSEESELAKQFAAFESRNPSLGVHLGLRRDCGSTLTPVHRPVSVSNYDWQEFEFTGAINNFPKPDVEADNVNYLAGIREIGVRSEYCDKRDMPRLCIQKIEFEGPFYEQWPPKPYGMLLQPGEGLTDDNNRAEKIIEAFATRAYRRPVPKAEVEQLMEVWRSQNVDLAFSNKLKAVLSVVLTSPQFLFLVENSAGPESEDIDDYELVSKLSYFLWNSPPDLEMMDLAKRGEVRKNLSQLISRAIVDERFALFAREFVSQWLSLDKFDVVNTDSKRFSSLTRDVKTELRREPIELWLHFVRQNRSIKDLVDSEEMVVNDVVADYYGLPNPPDSGYQFVPTRHEKPGLGGVLTLAAIQAGLSDGRQANPVKRGAWFARKIISEPPADPPPNVPVLEDLTQLSLRAKLEKHRNVKGCAKCHEGIDPWGLAFEGIDAGGILDSQNGDAQTKLPDGTELNGIDGLKNYLLEKRLDQVAFSVAKHLAIYANGRSLTPSELKELRENLLEIKNDGYRLQDIITCVVLSDSFLKK